MPNIPGAEAHLTGIAVDRVENGRIVKHWVEVDLHSFLQKIAPTPQAN